MLLRIRHQRPDITPQVPIFTRKIIFLSKKKMKDDDFSTVSSLVARRSIMFSLKIVRLCTWSRWPGCSRMLWEPPVGSALRRSSGQITLTSYESHSAQRRELSANGYLALKCGLTWRPLLRWADRTLLSCRGTKKKKKKLPHLMDPNLSNSGCRGRDFQRITGQTGSNHRKLQRWEPGRLSAGT